MANLWLLRFNTASGKHYCNLDKKFDEGAEYLVSIPQAVSTIAMSMFLARWAKINSFNTASGKHYCNEEVNAVLEANNIVGFNTASGKHYCNWRRKS